MRHPDFPHVDTAAGGPNTRNNPMDIRAIPAWLPDPPEDCYCTWHRFHIHYLRHYEQNWKKRKDGTRFQSTGDYKGPSYADYVPIDIDVTGDLGAAHSQAVELLAALEVDFGIEQGVRCWFSGSKGFHICLSADLFGGWNPSEALAGNIKRLVVALTGGISVDSKVYDQNRLWRIPNTINSKSGLYKIPLTRTELVSLSIEQILEMAKVPRNIDWPAWEDVEAALPAVDLWQSIKAAQPDKQEKATVKTGDLFRTDLKDGDGRDNQAFDLARRFRDWGVPAGATLEVLKLWDAALLEPLTVSEGEDILEKKVQSAFGDRADTEDRIGPGAIRSMGELLEDYGAYVESLKARAIRIGFPGLDRKMRGIAPGEVCTVIAKTSAGKTAFAQNILRNVAQDQGVTCLFCSMEQPRAQVLERFAQMASGHPGSEIEKNWADDDYRVSVIEQLSKTMGNNVWTCDLPRLKMEEIERLVLATEQRAGQSVGVLVIDYMGLLDTRDLDRTLYGQISEAARSMKTLAKKLDLAVIVLCQIGRSENDHGDKPLTLSSARESGAIEESADFLIGLYRPYIQREKGHDDDEMVLQLIKNRKGFCGKLICNFDASTLRITERGIGNFGNESAG